MPVDISYTVKASVANGRRLMKNDDGTTFWEGGEPEPVVEPVVEPQPAVVHKPKAKKLHHD